MEALVKVNINDINIENKDHIKDIYIFKLDDKKIGYGIITDNKDDLIKIYIDEEYRSNGYGKKFFGKMLGLINSNVKVKTDNEHMICIIKYYKGVELTRLNGIVSFGIPSINKGE